MTHPWTTTGSITLTGGYHCCITPSEENLWAEFLQDAPEWQAYQDSAVDVDILMARQQGTTENLTHTIREAVKAKAAYRAAMYELGKKWHKTMVRV